MTNPKLTPDYEADLDNMMDTIDAALKQAHGLKASEFNSRSLAMAIIKLDEARMWSECIGEGNDWNEEP